MDWHQIKIKAKVRLKFLRDRNFPSGRAVDWLGCPSRIDGFPTENMWDVRIQTVIAHVKKDEIINTQITFLSQDVARKYLKVGSKITLWENGDFAEGEITELLY